MQTYVVKIKSFKSVIKLSPLEKIPKNNKRRGMFIPDSRVEENKAHKIFSKIDINTDTHSLVLKCKK